MRTFLIYSAFEFSLENFCSELKGKILHVLTRSPRK
jgi:hypothetical protein